MVPGTGQGRYKLATPLRGAGSAAAGGPMGMTVTGGAGEATPIPDGAYIHLSRTTAQAIPATGAAIEWTATSSVLPPLNFTAPITKSP